MLTVMDVEDNKKRYGKLGTASFMQLRAAVIDSEEGILTTMEKPFMALEECSGIWIGTGILHLRMGVRIGGSSRT